MKNEELVLQIKAGQSKLLPVLWAKVSPFISNRASSYASAILAHDGFLRGFDVDDLIQQGYFALLGAIEYFDPAVGGTFLTVLDLKLRTAFQEVRGIRLSRSRNDALSASISADQPVNSDSEETILEFIPDLSCDIADQVTRIIYIDQLHNALERGMNSLTKKQAYILRQKYYAGHSIADIAQEQGQSISNIGDQEHKALRKLYRERRINGLSEFVEENTNYHLCVGAKQFQRTHTSAVELIVMRREKLIKQWERMKRETIE